MKKKGIIAGVLVLCILLVPTASAEQWNPGDNWGYLWEKDLAKKDFWFSGMGGDENIIKNFSCSGVHQGKWVYAYYIEYKGVENGYDRFDFHGAQYSWAYVDMDFSYEMFLLGKISANGHVMMKMKSMWIEFYGYFYLGKKNISTWSGEKSVYALYHLNSTVFTKEKLEYEVNTRAEAEAEFMGNLSKRSFETSASIGGTFNFTLTLESANGIPFLPVEHGELYYSDFQTLNYVAHANMNLKGRWSYKETNETGSDQRDGNVDISVDNDYSGSTEISPYISVSGNKVLRPGLVVNIATGGLGELGCVGMYGMPSPFESSSMTEPDIKGYINVLRSEVEATYDPGKTWYSKENITIYGTSQPADKSRVASIVENPKSVYGTYTEPQQQQDTTILFILIGIIVIVAVVVAVVAVVIVRKKKKQPPAPQQVPAQEMPPQYPQQPVQQYQAPPQPQYPQAPQQPQQPQPPAY
ncbi:MAG: hypothetical protein QXJ27_03250 [Thermoplasmata archaeon]